MKRWTTKAGNWGRSKVEESPAHVEAFLAEVFEVCRKHGLSISHEDGHGAFIVTDEDVENNITWLNDASLVLK